MVRKPSTGDSKSGTRDVASGTTGAWHRGKPGTRNVADCNTRDEFDAQELSSAFDCTPSDGFHEGIPILPGKLRTRHPHFHGIPRIL